MLLLRNEIVDPEVEFPATLPRPGLGVTFRVFENRRGLCGVIWTGAWLLILLLLAEPPRFAFRGVFQPPIDAAK